MMPDRDGVFTVYRAEVKLGDGAPWHDTSGLTGWLPSVFYDSQLFRRYREGHAGVGNATLFEENAEKVAEAFARALPKNCHLRVVRLDLGRTTTVLKEVRA